jgi:hypothetical protein
MGQPYGSQPGYPGGPIVTVVPIYPAGPNLPPSSPAYDPYAAPVAPPSPFVEPAPSPFAEPAPDTSYKSSFDSPSPKKAKKKKAKKELSLGISILPFGVPQFVGSKPLLGSLFAAGQGGALFLWYKSKTDADTALKNGQAEISRREGEASSQTNPEAYQEDTENYRKGVKKYVEDTELKSMVGLASFGAIWVLSFAESLVYGPATTASIEDPEGTENIATEEKQDRQHWQLIPFDEGLALGVTWNF